MGFYAGFQSPVLNWMKAFCLAAGHGTRLKPLTNNLPKCLVPVRGKPMLGVWLDIFRRFGITEVMINIHSHVEAVRNFVESNRGAVNVTIAEEKTLLGSAGTLRAKRDWLGDEKDFWVFYADVYNEVDLSAMLAFHHTHPAALATIGLYRVADPPRCGIAELGRDGLVVSFEEKPKSPKSDLAFAGIMLASSSILDLIPSPEEKPFADIGFDLLPKLVGKMYGYMIREFLIDIGTMENYQKVQQECR